MATALRQVLDYFDGQPGAIALPALARTLNLDRALVQEMLEYWVRKGRLREVAQPSSCTTCGGATGCPFIMALPRCYERVPIADAAPEPVIGCGCGCGRCG